MIRFTIETEIDLPRAEVFAYVTDPGKLASWQKTAISVTQEGDGPIGVGTRLHEVHRIPGGKELTVLVEVSEFTPDRTFSLRTVEGPIPLNVEVDFEPTAQGTRMLFTTHGEPRGAMRFLQPVLSRSLQHQLTEHCQTLKRILEGEEESEPIDRSASISET